MVPAGGPASIWQLPLAKEAMLFTALTDWTLSEAYHGKDQRTKSHQVIRYAQLIGRDWIDWRWRERAFSFLISSRSLHCTRISSQQASSIDAGPKGKSRQSKHHSAPGLITSRILLTRMFSPRPCLRVPPSGKAAGRSNEKVLDCT